jgi:hypothetical protein
MPFRRGWALMIKAFAIRILAGIVVVLAAAPLAGGFSRAEDKPPVDLHAIVIDPRNEFRQVALTDESIDRTLAAMGPMFALTLERTEAMIAISRSEAALWDKSVKLAESTKAFDQRARAIVEQAGFESVEAYNAHQASLWIAVAPAEADRLGRLSAEHLSLLKQADFMTRAVAGGGIASLERTISIARQQPLPANVALAAPYREAFLKAATKGVGVK